MDVSVGVRVKEMKGGGVGERASPERMVRRAGGMGEVGFSWMMERGVERNESSRAGLVRSRVMEDMLLTRGEYGASGVVEGLIGIDYSRIIAEM